MHCFGIMSVPLIHQGLVDDTKALRNISGGSKTTGQSWKAHLQDCTDEDAITAIGVIAKDTLLKCDGREIAKQREALRTATREDSIYITVLAYLRFSPSPGLGLFEVSHHSNPASFGLFEVFARSAPATLCVYCP